MLSTAHDDQEITEMYEKIKDLMKYVKGGQHLIIKRDWNPCVGKRKEGKVMCQHCPLSWQ